MHRIVAALTIAAVIGGSQAQAQLFFKRGLFNSELAGKLFGRNGRGIKSDQPAPPNRYRTPFPTSSEGISMGFGSYPYFGYPRPGQFNPYRFDNYVHDPYITGRFREPDLLNDPYFRERHRYESRFPGRYPALRNRYRGADRHPHGTVNAQPPAPGPHDHADRSHRNRMKPALPVPPLRDAPTPRSGSATSATGRLAVELAAREDGEAWMEFLAPDQIDRWIRSDRQDQLREYLSRYESVGNSDEFEEIVNVPGFRETLDRLRRHTATPPVDVELPAPGVAL